MKKPLSRRATRIFLLAFIALVIVVSVVLTVLVI